MAESTKLALTMLKNKVVKAISSAGVITYSDGTTEPLAGFGGGPYVIGDPQASLANDVVTWCIVGGVPNDRVDVKVYKDGTLISSGTTILDASGYASITASVQNPGAYRKVYTFQSTGKVVERLGTVYAGNSYSAPKGPFVYGFPNDAVEYDVVTCGIIGEPNEPFKIDLYKNGVLVSAGTTTHLDANGFWGVTAGVQTQGTYRHDFFFPNRNRNFSITGNVWPASGGGSYDAIIAKYIAAHGGTTSGGTSGGGTSGGGTSGGGAFVGPAAYPNWLNLSRSTPTNSVLSGLRCSGGTAPYSVTIVSSTVGIPMTFSMSGDFTYLNCAAMPSAGTIGSVTLRWSDSAGASVTNTYTVNGT